MYKYLIALLFISITSCSESNPTEVTTEEKSCCEKKEETTTSDGKKVSSESLFLLEDDFTTQNNQPFQLRQLEGKPTVVGMIFTHCAYACPRLTSDIMGIYEKLEEQVDDVNFLLVSFDINRDSPEQLKIYASQMGLPDSWTLLRGNEDAVRTMSILLNVQYEELEDGNFNHSNIISILNKDGELAYQIEGLEANQDGSLSTIKDILSK